MNENGAGRQPVRARERFRWVFKVRGLLMLPPVAFLASCDWGETEDHWITLGGGGIIFALGLGLRIWSQVHLRYRLRTRTETLLTLTGPYRFVRNPVYLGNVLLLLACCLLAELPWSAPIILGYILGVYHLVVRFEEAHLLNKHGQAYLQFLQAVPRWLPKLPAMPRISLPALRQWIGPAVAAEIHNLALLLPFVAKEFLFR